LKKAICIISGGMDSALAAFIARNDGYEIVALHLNYGQRTERKELQAFDKIADALGARKVILDAHLIARIGGASLTDESLAVRTEGIEEGIPNTYVPFRNGIFIAIAAALAEAHDAEALYLGVIEEDSSGYPDCTERFITKMQDAINEGTRPETMLAIRTPLVHMTKEDIVREALKIGVPLEHTWSCYTDEEKACGVCDSCRLRLKGFEKAGAKDPIEYK
jgi:7-cyano-7-deazaguanine synthase